MTKTRRAASHRHQTTSTPAWRHRSLVVFILLGFGVLVGRLGWIQIIQHRQYVARAEVQYGMVRDIPATRGTIMSADGFDLAATQPAYLIYANPKQIKDPNKVASTLVDILNEPDDSPLAKIKNLNTLDHVDSQPDVSTATYSKKNLLKQLTMLEKDWVPLARKVSQEKVDRIKAKHLDGVDFQTQQRRYYPEGSLASQILGFVAQTDDGGERGYYGIEGYFDRDLRGRDGKTVYDRDPEGNPIPVGNYQTIPAVNGKNITLTIRRNLQYILEQELQKGVEDKGAEAGSVILMVPQSGKVLAMANYPTFDPRNLAKTKDVSYFKNRTITDAYEPGSVMKTFTVATGIEDGILTPQSTYKSAPYKVGDHVIETANKVYFGPNTTATKMLEMSDNTGAAQFGMKIGRDRFLASINEIGLNRVTGITLEGEASGIIPGIKDWLPITLATASFGQGISVTPLQLIQMMSTIANDGVQMKPTIISSVEENGQTTVVKPEQVGRIFSQSTAAQVTEMLRKVVINGEFRRLALQGYDIAGKTSTSQIPIPGGYDLNHTITTFVGFAPADDPKFVMLVKLDKPLINNSAETVVPVWMKMAEHLFEYYGIKQEK